ncbi:ABC-2 type transport system ATP-binding protein [Polymorphobacter multimanifer]|uniref:ABC-2 type transport system ATP-binding protein n=1 Tax=Polymorphobacter multimanifer TaxID=1070431 RepID=A0A841L219_9SPHN|nr:ABC transporter ATP-binding protein [Polymorphobacter multimanifer]MBB6226480.1 ABC-2 type transport system ATP-binding protein [Polymorphobacter multimanifer]
MARLADSGAPLLAVAGLVKRHGTTAAVAGVDLMVAPGEIVGLLGANGAGKTSLIECIAGLATPDAGTIRIAGVDAGADPRGARRLCGVALQSTGLPPRLTVAETVALFAVLHGGADTDGLIDRFGLAGKAGARCETLSGGQRQRLALALALIGDPPLLILDEPGAGLDPAIRDDFHGLIETLRSSGRGLLIATHDLAEAARLCDRVVVMAAGRVVAAGSPGALIEDAGGLVRLRVRTRPAVPDTVAAEIAGDARLAQDGELMVFSGGDLRAVLARLGAALATADIAIVDIATETASLEALIVAMVRRADG